MTNELKAIQFLSAPQASNRPLSTADLAELFQTDASTVETSLSDLADEQRREAQHLVWELGYRLRTPAGVAFRRWASACLTSVAVKGFALDDKRLADPCSGANSDVAWQYLKRIRSSASRFDHELTQSIKRSANACVIDECIKQFVAEALDTLRHAVNEQAGDEEQLARIVSMFLDYAEDRSRQRRNLKLSDWQQYVDGFLVFNELLFAEDQGNINRDRDEEFEAERKNTDALKADVNCSVELEKIEKNKYASGK